MSALLSHRINTLLLNARAPFPSETRDAHDIVRKWRLEQRLKLVRSADADRLRADDGVDHHVAGDEK